MTQLPSHADVERFRAVVARRFGLQFDAGRLDFLAEVLRQRSAASRDPTAGSYLERVASLPKRADELAALAQQLTVNETFFFRNPDAFRALTERVLPERMRAKEPHRAPLRMLSAGCASGEEPYSLAMTLVEAIPDLERRQVEILGVDVNAAVLQRAARARYTEWALRETPEELRRRYFRAEGRELVLDPRIQQMVTFEEGNLIDDDARLWPPARYDVVFCRNVIMYFGPEVMRDVIRRIEQSLVPGGFLFLGHAETLRGLSQDFHLCHTHDTFYYQKRTSAQARARAVAVSAPAEDVAMVALPRMVEDAVSWVDAIKRASERIAALAGAADHLQHGDQPAPAAAPSAARSWDLGLVLEAMRQERFADALALLSALPREANEAPDALLLRAVLLTNRGELGAAERACARVLELEELNAGAHYLMALCREHTGDVAGAAEHDQTAIYLDPAFAMPHLHLGLMARRAGDLTGAEAELAQAIALLPLEDASRLLLFGGGFQRDTLLALARAELAAVRGAR